MFAAASTSAASAQKKTTKHAETRTSAAASETSTVAFPLELNAASAEELGQLPGIGPVLAERIVSYRSQIGCFQNREQLLDVEGIGTATYAAIVDLLYLTEEYDLSDPAEPETEESQVVPEVPEAAPAVIPPAHCQAPLPAPPGQPGNVPEESPQEPVTEAEIQPVDLNTASRKELMQIPDMTPELAEEILQFRQENQYFSSIYELLYLEHMTDSYFQKIREKIVVLSK